MTYFMNIKDEYIEAIKAGIKKREYRLAKPERLKINIGDIIRLVSDNDENYYIDVKVIGISKFKDWNDALKKHWEEDFKGLYDNFNDVIIECKKYYKEEDIQKYGIIVFDIIFNR